MKISQLIVIGLSLVLFLLLYFGCETKAPEQVAIEKSRALNIETTTITNLLRDAKAQINSTGGNAILSLEAMLEQSAEDTSRISILKQLSGKWYELGHPAIAGYYAEEVANLEESAYAWSMAGTTYNLGMKQSQTTKEKDFCYERAVTAFESAISIDPSDPTNKLNLALLYTERPPKDNPMKGILMLRDLSTEYPKNEAVLFHLGRLAIMTGQFDKAVERLTQAMEIDPTSKRIPCLLVEAYKGLGDQAKANAMAEACGQ